MYIILFEFVYDYSTEQATCPDNLLKIIIAIACNEQKTTDIEEASDIAF